MGARRGITHFPGISALLPLRWCVFHALTITTVAGSRAQIMYIHIILISSQYDYTSRGFRCLASVTACVKLCLHGDMVDYVDSTKGSELF